MREIELYETLTGRSPVRDFIRGLPPTARHKLGRVLDVVRNSPRVPATYLKKLRGTEELWEVRVHDRGNEYRLLCFYYARSLIVLVSGFAKKTERVPTLEIQLAHQRRRDYLTRSGGHGRS
jgi:phage-related protein